MSVEKNFVGRCTSLSNKIAASFLLPIRAVSEGLANPEMRASSVCGENGSLLAHWIESRKQRILDVEVGKICPGYRSGPDEPLIVDLRRFCSEH
jgi:hypothetical protein